MPEVSFETALAKIFGRCEQALHAQLDKAKTRAENLQAEDTSRLAFTLTETIEHADAPGARMIEAGLQLEVGGAGEGAGDDAHDQVADRVRGRRRRVGGMRHARNKEEG